MTGEVYQQLGTMYQPWNRRQHRINGIIPLLQIKHSNPSIAITSHHAINFERNDKRKRMEKIFTPNVIIGTIGLTWVGTYFSLEVSLGICCSII